MPATGKHRRKKSGPLSRGILAAGAGGAVLALPLIGATGAHAAEPASPAAKSAAVTRSAPAAVAKDSPKTYTVVSGDNLAKIATAKKIKGGWQKLYKDNRDVIGDNPGLIVPGMKLTLGAKASGTAGKPTAATHAQAETKPATKAAPAAEKAAASESTASGWAAPVENPTVTTQYHVAGASWASGYHTGSDFQAASGTSVRSIGPGTVVSAGWSGAYGNEIVIQHSDGMYSQYAHLSSLEVSAGQTVTGGQQIGLSGTTGNSTGPHLHFEVRTGPSYGSDVDPIAYLRSHGVSI
ncbi:LysM peptidoglycan-binding domain-containing M23 family metallopeptidase [Streptomyces sp. NBC_01341]|uniref:M23 family metallopeptidase n=1 Tax=Streptomyces sp. NBC_01341 TaxID=2903831 RepID=UPI002E14DC08|nr:LysM peptidoglycan-binding domain-containing M23 family metallopeptidase [Streptomyces sp. NBC_01341]